MVVNQLKVHPFQSCDFRCQPAPLQRELFVTFEPKLPNAIVTSIPLECETGIVHVPLEAYPKCADVFTPTPVVDFGTVTHGEVGWRRKLDSSF